MYMSHFGYGAPYGGTVYGAHCGGYGYGYGAGTGYGNSFALIVVLFILLIIVGTAFYA